MAFWWETNKTVGAVLEDQARVASVSVTNASTNITRAKKRQMFYILNTSTSGQVITLSYGKTAVLNTGINLEVGSSWCETNDQGFTCWQGDIFAIASATGATVSIVER